MFVNIVYNYFLVAVGAGCSRGVALLNTLIIARILGPSSYGVFAIFYAVMILAWQFPSAFDAVFVAYAKQIDHAEGKNDLLKCSIILKILYLMVALVVSYPLAWFLGVHVFQKIETVMPIVAAMVCGVSLMFLVSIASIFQEKEKFGRYAITNAFYTVSVFILLLLLHVTRLEFTLQNVILVYFSISLIIGVLCIMILWKQVGNFFNFNKSVLVNAFKQGKWILAVVAFESIFMRLDLLFLTRHVDNENLGIYAVAATLIQVVFLATGALAGVCLPKAGTAVRSKDQFSIFVRESLLMVSLIIAGILVFIWLAPLIVTLLYGAEYGSASRLIRIMLIGWIFYVVFIPFSFLFIALGDARTRFTIEFIKLALGITLLVILIPLYGAAGAAGAISLTYIAASFYGLIMAKYRIFNNFKKEVGPLPGPVTQLAK